MISGTTRIVGIIGDPIAGSLSPQMHNAAFAAAGLDWAYAAFKVNKVDLSAAIAAVRALDMAGLNVTMPHKEPVIAYLDEIDKPALEIRSVNTIVNSKGKLKGFSTDGEGFRRALADQGYKAAGKRVFIIGAGGAARAVARALADNGASEVNVACRDADSGRKLADIALASGAKSRTFDLAKNFAEEAGRADLVINATPLGKKSIDDIKFLVDGLTPGQFIADLSTVPPLTAFLVAAQDRGCSVMGGLGMLVHQGSLSYELWTGKKAPLAVMKRAVGEEL